MYEPWGYVDENNYLSSEIIMENDLYEFFADTKYVKDDNKIYFYNKDGDKVGELDVSEFVKSDSIIEKTEYSDGILTITFTNGDVITIDLTELIDEDEFKDGLTISDHVVKVLVDPTSERWLTVSEDGVKVSGIQAEIDRLDEKIDNEVSRATQEEARIDAKLDQEIADRIADVDEEENRAKAAEQTLTTNLNDEITRATRTEQAVNLRVDTLNDELDSEESRAQAAEQELRLLLTGEISRATSAETTLDDKITSLRQALNNEIDRATSAETSLDNKIDQEIEDRKSEAIASADYDDNNKTIDFYNANNVKIDSIDATPFITAGMIDSVYVDHETEELVIVWITETGTEETRISLSEIFNPDDYYTKGEIDEIISGITESEEDLEDKIAQLRRALNDEIDRATGKEEELDGEDIASGNISSDATFSMTRNNGNIITFTSAEQIDLEAGEF